MSRHIQTDYLRSVVFGIEDGLVSTTGSVIGISAGSGDTEVVVLAGLVLVAVEAVSMAAGQFLSERTVHEFEAGKHSDSLMVGSLLMFVSYIIAGLIPVLPFIFLTIKSAAITSLLAAFVSLFVLGYVKAKVTHVKPWRSGLEILVIGGVAVIIGAIVGWLLKIS